MKISRMMLPIAMAILSLHLAFAAAIAGQLDIWTWRNPVPTPNPLYGVTHGLINGNTLWVVVGANSTVLTSSDGGSTWSLQAPPSPLATLNSVAYSPAGGPSANHFVAVGSNNTNGNDVILFSPDGTNWTAATGLGLDGYGGLFGVAYGGGDFMAVGFDGYNYHSSDGQNWTEGINFAGDGIGDANGVAYGDGMFVAVGDNGVSTTTDLGATAWTIPPNPPNPAPTFLSGVTWNSVSGEFVAVGYGAILNSPDGVNWYEASGDSGNGVAYGLISGGSGFVAVNDYTPYSIYTSPGGNSGADPWTATTGNYPFAAIDWDGVNGNYVAVGANGTIATSYDGTHWGAHSSSKTSNSLNAIAYGANLFVAVGANGAIVTSPDGTTWTPVNSSVTPYSLNAITYGVNANGVNLFMAGGTNNSWGGTVPGGPGIFTSQDGYDNWSLDSDPSLNPSQNSVLPDGYVNGLAYGNLTINNIPTPEFVALVNITANRSIFFAGSALISSTDGSTWSYDEAASVFNLFNGVAFGKNATGQPVLVVVGNESTALWSTDLHNWTPGSGLPASLYFNINAVAYGNGMFIAVGVTNYTAGAIFSSPDGANWNLVKLPTTPTPAPFSSVTFANGFFVATTGSEYGSSGNIWVSPDGVNWVQTSVTAPGSLTAVASGDFQYIAVGSGGDILGSVLETVAASTYSGGIFSFSAYGPPGMEYGVYVSNDLVTWTWLKNVIIPSGATSVSVSDNTPVNYSQGYYYLGPPGPP